MWLTFGAGDGKQTLTYLTKRFSPSASTSRARPSDAATFDKD